MNPWIGLTIRKAAETQQPLIVTIVGTRGTITDSRVLRNYRKHRCAREIAHFPCNDRDRPIAPCDLAYYLPATTTNHSRFSFIWGKKLLCSLQIGGIREGFDVRVIFKRRAILRRFCNFIEIVEHTYSSHDLFVSKILIRSIMIDPCPFSFSSNCWIIFSKIGSA